MRFDPSVSTARTPLVVHARLELPTESWGHELGAVLIGAGALSLIEERVEQVRDVAGRWLHPRVVEGLRGPVPRVGSF